MFDGHGGGGGDAQVGVGEEGDGARGAGGGVLRGGVVGGGRRAQLTGIVETVLCGVVGREPARDGRVEAFRDCMVPILR